jgi:hypothetical protein
VLDQSRTYGFYHGHMHVSISIIGTYEYVGLTLFYGAC